MSKPAGFASPHDSIPQWIRAPDENRCTRGHSRRVSALDTALTGVDFPARITSPPTGTCMAVTSSLASDPAARAGLTRDQLLEIYYWMRLTRSLEERLVNLYRQTKVVGGLFRSLGQEACAVGSAYALEREDVLSPLIRNLGSMLVKGASPVEVVRQYMAKGDSPTRGRELNIHFGDLEERNFLGQISHLGDMV